MLEIGGTTLVLTHDVIVEGVHFLASDPPDTVGWKLAAVNLSDLAAKGAAPLACLMSHSLGSDAGWDAAFLAGLGRALDRFGMPLLGGDTVTPPAGSARHFGLTAIGRATHCPVPSRAGARPGDRLWVTGTIGGAGHGLALLKTDISAQNQCVDSYRQPIPRLDEGCALARHVTAMMDVSDGLLIDAARMAAASGLAVAIDLAAVRFAVRPGDDRIAAMLAASTAGDDYELLFALPPETAPPVAATSIGVFASGSGLSVSDGGTPVPLPARLGWEHGEPR